MIFEAAVDGQTVRVEVRQADGRFTLAIDGAPMVVDFREAGAHFASLLVSGRSYDAGIERRTGGYRITLPGDTLDVQIQEAGTSNASPAKRPASGPARLEAPMPGRIVRVLGAVGQEVAFGQGLVVMEAMKMENELRAPRAGRIREIRAIEGQAVETGSLLLVLD